MDWRVYLASLTEFVERVPAPKWLGVAAIFAALILLVALIVAWVRNLSLRYRLAEHEERAQTDTRPAAAGEEAAPALSLEGEGRTLVDRIFPRRPRNFLLFVAVVAAASWALGYWLAADRSSFRIDPEWQAQPFYLAVHFIALRLFATAFARHFRAGTAHLQMSPDNAQRAMRLVIGPLGALVAVAVAAPFCVYEYFDLYLQKAGATGAGRGAELLLFGLWCLEWLLTAFIWVMLAGFLVLTHWAIGRHGFRSPITVVLHERQYRPFLQMSAQGATIVLGFWVANVLYVLYTGGSISDYVGVIVTLALLIVGFVPPLLYLRGKVKHAVDDELSSLRLRLGESLKREGLGAPAALSPAQSSQVNLDQVALMQRISYLEQRYSRLGRSEVMDVVIRLLVPATTMAWYLNKYLKGMS